MMEPDQETSDGLKAISVILSASRIDLVTLKAHLVGLLEHLASPTGRTDENCRAVDAFFCLDNSWRERALP